MFEAENFRFKTEPSASLGPVSAVMSALARARKRAPRRELEFEAVQRLVALAAQSEVTRAAPHVPACVTA